jgi:hypothetical protein
MFISLVVITIALLGLFRLRRPQVRDFLAYAKGVPDQINRDNLLNNNIILKYFWYDNSQLTIFCYSELSVYLFNDRGRPVATVTARSFRRRLARDFWRTFSS